jgi:hypothetical protein
MSLSEGIARILGPVLTVLPVTEGINLQAFAGNPAPVVFLNGTLLFTGGVAILQATSDWRTLWSRLVAFAGLIMIFVGLYRMGWPSGAQAIEGVGVYFGLTMLFLLGLGFTWRGYVSNDH